MILLGGDSGEVNQTYSTSSSVAGYLLTIWSKEVIKTIESSLVAGGLNADKDS